MRSQYDHAMTILPFEPLFADLTGQLDGLELAACVMVGGAVFLVAQWLVRVLYTEDVKQGAEWRYDVSRINELRRLDPTYRVFHPAIRLLAALNRAALRDSLPEVQREIQAAGLPRFWLAEEYLARAELFALFATPLYVYFCYSAFGWAGLLVAAMAMLVTVWLLRWRLSQKAQQRLKDIKRRMPFLLDLLTLLMEAGSTFLGALRGAVEEFRGHPVAEEFGRVLADMNMGKTRHEAFTAMKERLADDEIASILGSILQGEALGTPLAQIFRTQADVLRIKRTQRAESVAGEAAVNMLLPGILVMAAAALVIVGPFLLNYIYSGFFL